MRLISANTPYRYLAAITYRFNRRFKLRTLPQRLLVAAASTDPRLEPNKIS